MRAGGMCSLVFFFQSARLKYLVMSWAGLRPTSHIWWVDLHGSTFPHRLDNTRQESRPQRRTSEAGQETNDRS